MVFANLAYNSPAGMAQAKQQAARAMQNNNNANGPQQQQQQPQQQQQQPPQKVLCMYSMLGKQVGTMSPQRTAMH